MTQLIPEVAAVASANRGKPFELECEQQDQQDAQIERWHGQSAKRQNASDVVGQPVAIDRHVDANWNAKTNPDQDPERRELERVGEAMGNLAADRGAVDH